MGTAGLGADLAEEGDEGVEGGERGARRGRYEVVRHGERESHGVGGQRKGAGRGGGGEGEGMGSHWALSTTPQQERRWRQQQRQPAVTVQPLSLCSLPFASPYTHIHRMPVPPPVSIWRRTPVVHSSILQT